jgi:H+-transporting ATPase
MRRITVDAVALGLCKLAFSTALLALAQYRLGLGPKTLQTFAFVTVLFGSQGLIYVLRERRHMWSSMPSKWVFASSAVDIGIVTLLALTGTLMEPLPWHLLLAVFVVTAAFAFILDQIKRMVTTLFKVE